MIKRNGFFKKKRLIIASVSLVIIAVVSTLFLTVYKNNDIPPLFMSTENGSVSEAVKGGYEWNFGTIKPEYTIADTKPVYNFEYEDKNIITVAPKTQLHISNQKKKSDRKQKVNSFVSTLYNPDGTVYENYKQALKPNFDNGQMVIYMEAPEDIGEYILELEMEYDRGKVYYGFKIVVDADVVDVNSEYYKKIQPISYPDNYEGIKVTIYDWVGKSSDALEVIYEDDECKFYLSSIRSDKIILEFENGEKLSLKEALKDKKIDIKDLTQNGLNVKTEIKNNPLEDHFIKVSSDPFAPRSFLLNGKRFYPSNTFMCVQYKRKYISYFAVEEFLNILKDNGYKEKAEELRSSDVLKNKFIIINGKKYLSDSNLSFAGILVMEGWQSSSHISVFFKILFL